MNTTPKEHDEQVALFQWAEKENRWQELSLLFAIPNGGKRTPRTAGMLKAEGVKPGVPDICLPVARKGYHGLYIELKRRMGSRVSLEQKRWLMALEQKGYRCCVCHGWDEARKAIETYLEGAKSEDTEGQSARRNGPNL